MRRGRRKRRFEGILFLVLAVAGIIPAALIIERITPGQVWLAVLVGAFWGAGMVVVYRHWQEKGEQEQPPSPAQHQEEFARTLLLVVGLEELLDNAVNRIRNWLDAERVDARIDSNAVKEIVAEFRGKKRAENAAFERSAIQGAISVVINLTSPFATYLIGGTEITGVGMASGFSFLNYTKRQERVLTEYLQEKWQAAVSFLLDTVQRPGYVEIVRSRSGSGGHGV